MTRKRRLKMNKKIFRQYEGSWAKKPYPTKRCTVSGAGCGLVACTHIAIEQERYKNWTPNDLRPYMLKYAVAGQGTKWEGITETLKHLGHKTVVRVYNDPMSVAWKELNKGNRIGIILFDSSYAPNGIRWTSCGHYVAFTDYKIKDGKHLFYCKDSGGRKHDGWYSYERSMKNCVFKMWIVERINPAVAPIPVTPAVTPDGKLVEDGVGGKATAKAMQRFFGTPQDGMLGGQSKAQRKYYTAMTAVKYGKGGSPCVKAMQKWLGVAQDGVWGKATSKALQKKLGVKEDGFFGRASMKAWQKYLNTYDKAVYPIKPKKAKDNGDKVADMAESYIGKSKYVKGGTNIKTGVDCTGFVQEMYRLALGIKLPASLSAWGKSIGTDISKAQRGDIISYRNKSNHKLRHHAIYVGNKKVVHASGSHTNHKKDIIKSGYNFDGMYVEGIRRRWK
jgi:hypothetical protein